MNFISEKELIKKREENPEDPGLLKTNYFIMFSLI